MELKEGMYIRTKDRGIHKISRIDNNKTVWKYICDYRPSEDRDGTYTYGIYKMEEIIKASNNIIDLIEVGDYVNGSEVMEADWINADREYEEGLAFPMYASDDLEVIENWLPLRSVPIKSIVTKEHFESISYRVEE